MEKYKTLQHENKRGVDQWFPPKVSMEYKMKKSNTRISACELRANHITSVSSSINWENTVLYNLTALQASKNLGHGAQLREAQAPVSRENQSVKKRKFILSKKIIVTESRV